MYKGFVLPVVLKRVLMLKAVEYSLNVYVVEPTFYQYKFTDMALNRIYMYGTLKGNNFRSTCKCLEPSLMIIISSPSVAKY